MTTSTCSPAPRSNGRRRGSFCAGAWPRSSGRIVRDPYRVRFGIEAFFAPKEKALELEKDLRNGGAAILMVSNSGRAALKDVIPDPAPDPDADPDRG